MIIVIKPSTPPEKIRLFTDKLCSDYEVKVNRWDGIHSTVLGLIGDTHTVDIEYQRKREQGKPVLFAASRNRSAVSYAQTV